MRVSFARVFAITQRIAEIDKTTLESFEKEPTSIFDKNACYLPTEEKPRAAAKDDASKTKRRVPVKIAKVAGRRRTTKSRSKNSKNCESRENWRCRSSFAFVFVAIFCHCSGKLRYDSSGSAAGDE